MPHVRKSEYKIPSSEYQLQYVEIIQRHHKVNHHSGAYEEGAYAGQRTPYASNTFFKEDITVRKGITTRGLC